MQVQVERCGRIQMPARLQFDAREVEIVENVDRWYGPPSLAAYHDGLADFVTVAISMNAQGGRGDARLIPSPFGSMDQFIRRQRRIAARSGRGGCRRSAARSRC